MPDKLLSTLSPATMTSSLESCNDLAAGLHITSATLFASNFRSMLHFPGKLTPRVIDTLKEKLTPEVHGILTEVQENVMRQLNGHNVDSEEFIGKLKSLLHSE